MFPFWMQTGFVVSSLVSSHASYGPSHFPAWCVAHWKTERYLPFPKQIVGNLGDFQPCFITQIPDTQLSPGRE